MAVSRSPADLAFRPASTCCRSSGVDLQGQQQAAPAAIIRGSLTVTIRSAAMLSRTCFLPLGQTISTVALWSPIPGRSARGCRSPTDNCPTSSRRPTACRPAPSRRCPSRLLARALQFQRQPVVRTGRPAKHQRTAAEHRHHDVDRAVVVQIPEGHAAPGHVGQRPEVRLLELARRRCGTAPEAPGSAAPEWIRSTLSSTWLCATNRSFQPSLSKSWSPRPQPELRAVSPARPVVRLA